MVGVVSPYVLWWWAFTRARTAPARTAIAWAGTIMAVGSVTRYAVRVAWPTIEPFFTPACQAERPCLRLRR